MTDVQDIQQIDARKKKMINEKKGKSTPKEQICVRQGINMC